MNRLAVPLAFLLSIVAAPAGAFPWSYGGPVCGQQATFEGSTAADTVSQQVAAENGCATDGVTQSLDHCDAPVFGGGGWGTTCYVQRTWPSPPKSVLAAYGVSKICGVWPGTVADANLLDCVCPPGTSWNAAQNQCTGCPVSQSGECVQVQPKNNGCPKDVCPKGNPVNPGTGNKFQREPVYTASTPGGLVVALTYNGLQSFAISTNQPRGMLGMNWSMAYAASLRPSVGGAIEATRAEGRVFEFRPTPSGTTYVSDGDVSDRLESLSGPAAGWRYTVADTDDVELYDSTGRLLSITSRAGLVTRLTYADGNNGVLYADTSSDPATAGPLGYRAPACQVPHPASPFGGRLRAGTLLCATDAFGRQIHFQYLAAGMSDFDARARVQRIIDPAGQSYMLEYDGSSGPAGADNLTRITFPDGTTRVYHYAEAAQMNGGAACASPAPGLQNALTAITDENHVRFATWSYDCAGRATSSRHAGDAELVTLSYGAGATVTVDALGTSRTTALQNAAGVIKPAGETRPAASGVGTASDARSYDANGNLASRTDYNGSTTTYTYDLARNLQTSRIEAAGTSQSRTISTQWHPVFQLSAAVAEPLRITTYVYNGDGGTRCGFQADGTALVPGALCSKTVQPTSDATGAAGFGATPAGPARTWRYTYNPHGLVLTADGPRTDVSDVTTYTYYTDGDADPGKRGNIASVTNALGQVTSITAYNGHGRPTTVVDANGLATTLAYDSRQRLVSRSVGGETTTYDYDGAGQLANTTLPDGSFLQYAHDDAHRLTGMADNLGNRIAYTLDAMGNRTQEQVFDPASSLAQTRSRVFDALNRLARDVGAQDQTTAYAYDDQGNVTSVTDPLGRVTANKYDALNRLVQVTDPGLGVTRYGYNGIDQLTSVTDPRNLATSYAYDGLSNLNQQVSPDTGTTTSSYDAAGNLVAQTDAKGQTTTYAYDALNRVASITFADGSKQTYTYDQGPNGVGRLTLIAELDPGQTVTGQIGYAYDAHGRVTAETRTIAGANYTTQYRYDSAGRMSGMTYPDGRVVTYSLDALGRITQVSQLQPGWTQSIVVSDVTYRPFGGVASYTLGNGQQMTRGYDLDGRISSYTLLDQTWAIGYDAASRISFISDATNPSIANNYGYDALDRLTSAVVPGNQYAYAYDAVGNRTSKTVGGATDTYAYAPTSNRLASIAAQAGAVRNFASDPNGSTVDDGVNQYVYDARGRMVQSIGALGTTTYLVNALGQRVRKTNASEDRIFHYDLKGHLIAETDPGGTFRREYIWLGDIPVGVIQ